MPASDDIQRQLDALKKRLDTATERLWELDAKIQCLIKLITK